jgi:hypothetical protein
MSLWRECWGPKHSIKTKLEKNMDNSIHLSVTPIQAFVAMAFQVWMIVFPILLIRKINYLTDLVQEHLDEHQGHSSSS